MRFLYSLLFYLALPGVLLRLWWKSLRQGAYRKRIKERFGFYPFTLEQCIWVHAVSVGETIAAIPLIKALKKQYPEIPLLVTTMTPTGTERVKTAFADSVYHVYLPYDLPSAMQRFFNAMRPCIAIILETELWPNMLFTCEKRNIPVCLVNARLSERSKLQYQRIAKMTSAMLKRLTLIAAHGAKDAERFIELTAAPKKVVVTGNIKFDLELPADLAEKSDALRQSFAGNRFIWIAASTHEGEEEIILAAHARLREKNPEALLILVPRHPNRFDSIAELCTQSFVTKRRSHQEVCTKETAVYLGDTMGELLLLYGAADVAFVGGSLIERGGHNMLEPGALAKPILTGPHLFNFAEISELLSEASALKKVQDAEGLVKELENLMLNETLRARMGENALQVVAANRGALAKQMQLIMPLISAAQVLNK